MTGHLVAAVPVQTDNVSPGGGIAFLVVVAVIYGMFWMARGGSPIEVLRRTSDMSGRPDIPMSGHDVRRSEAVDTPDPSPPVDMSTVHRRPTLDVEGWAVEPDTTRVRVDIPRRRPTATRPADVPVEDQELSPRKPTPPAERLAWLRARQQPGDPLARGRTVKELDEMAKDLFGVTDRQLRRDRMLIKKRAGA